MVWRILSSEPGSKNSEETPHIARSAFDFLIAVPFALLSILVTTGFLKWPLPISLLIAAYVSYYSIRVATIAGLSNYHTVLTVFSSLAIPFVLSLQTYYIAFVFYQWRDGRDPNDPGLTELCQFLAIVVYCGYFFSKTRLYEPLKSFLGRARGMSPVLKIRDAITRTAQLTCIFMLVLLAYGLVEWFFYSYLHVPREKSVLFASAAAFGTWYFTRDFYHWIHTPLKPPRGAELFDHAQALRISQRLTKKDALRLFWGGVFLPRHAANKNFCIAGAIGSGKTKNIRLLMQSALPHIGSGFGHRALIYDAKADHIPLLVAYTKEGVIRPNVRFGTLNPFEARPEYAWAWDMAKDSGTDFQVADEFAAIFIRNDDSHGTASHFRDAARLVLGGIMKVYMATCPGRWLFRDVIIAALYERDALIELLNRIPETRWMVKEYFDDRDSGRDVIQTLKTQMGRFQSVAAAWANVPKERLVSLDEWLNGKEEYIILLGNDEERKSGIDADHQVIVLRLGQLINKMSKDEQRRTWLFFDEIREAGHLHLNPVFTKGRERGACVVIGFQDRSGMDDAYNDNENLVNEMLGQAKNKIILSLETDVTATWAEKQFGYQEVTEERESYSHNASSGTSINVTQETRVVPVVMASTFMSSKEVPPCTKENGLTGYSKTPFIGQYSMHLSGKYIEQTIINEDESVPGVVPRSADELKLGEWSEKDLERLSLPLTIRQAQEETIKYTQSPEAQKPIGDDSRANKRQETLERLRQKAKQKRERGQSASI